MAIQFYDSLTSGGDITADSFVKDGGTSTQYLMADGSVSSGPSGGISEVVAGTNLTGGGTASTVTLNMATGGIGAGDYGSDNNGLKIDKITVDAYGRITAVTTGLTGSGNGDITAVNTSSGSGLSGGSTSGSVSLSIDMTGTNNYISAASSTLTSADSGDLIPIVDISSSNTVKKITAANLVGAGGGVTSTTSGEPSGSSTITNIVQIDLSDYNTAASNGNLVTGTVYLIK